MLLFENHSTLQSHKILQYPTFLQGDCQRKLLALRHDIRSKFQKYGSFCNNRVGLNLSDLEIMCGLRGKYAILKTI